MVKDENEAACVECNKKMEKAREMIKNSMIRLSECWEHHQDGSDLRVNNSTLFSIVFNEVFSGHEQCTRVSPHGTEFKDRIVGETGLRQAFALLGGDSKEIQYL